MVGQWTVTKPSRSDEVLDAEQQLKIANQIRAQFDSLAPKLPTKPNRSEPDSNTSSVVSTMDPNITELDKLRSPVPISCLYSVKISMDGDTVVQDEFVETEYYKDFCSIDKQHHTTGSEFIRVVREGGEEKGHDTIQLKTSHGGGSVKAGFKSNPATNDWIPNFDEDQVFFSSKPNRSESP